MRKKGYQQLNTVLLSSFWNAEEDLIVRRFERRGTEQRFQQSVEEKVDNKEKKSGGVGVDLKGQHRVHTKFFICRRVKVRTFEIEFR